MLNASKYVTSNGVLIQLVRFLVRVRLASFALLVQAFRFSFTFGFRSARLVLIPARPVLRSVDQREYDFEVKDW